MIVNANQARASASLHLNNNLQISLTSIGEEVNNATRRGDSNCTTYIDLNWDNKHRLFDELVRLGYVVQIDRMSYMSIYSTSNTVVRLSW